MVNHLALIFKHPGLRIGIVLGILLSGIACSQPPFENEIKAFKTADKENPPPQNPVLFVGSSSIRLWKNIHNDFPDSPVINRGFGGSTLKEVTFYADDIIFPYEPDQIVIYCGENDLTEPNMTAASVFQRFVNLFEMIRHKMPDVNVVFISVKPSPSRAHLRQQIKSLNTLIKNYLAEKENTSFVDVYSLMVDKSGEPKKDLFVEDMLHMNEQGYEIWQKALKPYILKEE